MMSNYSSDADGGKAFTCVRLLLNYMFCTLCVCHAGLCDAHTKFKQTREQENVSSLSIFQKKKKS